MAKKVLICGQFSAKEKEQFKAVIDNIIFMSRKNVTAETLQGVDAVIGSLSPELIKTNNNLEWVQLLSSGADSYIKAGAISENTILTSATGAYGVGIAEYMVTMLLVMMKKIPAYLNNQQNKLWKYEGKVVSPAGKRVLIVGAGNIGLEFAKRMRAFNCNLIGIRRTNRECPTELDEVYNISEIDREVGRADIIALCLPGTDETYHLFNEQLLKSCKNGAFLINVGRGNVIDTDILLKPEVYANFSGMWLDVFENEPLPKESPIYTIPNLLITPHITGGFHLDITLQRIFEICLHNLKAWNGDGEFISKIDLNTGYCS